MTTAGKCIIKTPFYYSLYKQLLEENKKLLILLFFTTKDKMQKNPKVEMDEKKERKLLYDQLFRSIW